MTVSKLQGHSKIATAQIYANVIERKICEDMASLKEKIFKTQLNNNLIQKID